MRTFMRQVVDVDRPLDLDKINGFRRITTAIRYQIHQTSLYKKMQAKQLEEEQRERLKQRENLQNILLYKITTELINNPRVASIDILIDRQFESVLEDVLNSDNFYYYSITQIQENPNYLESFPHMEIKLHIERRLQ